MKKETRIKVLLLQQIKAVSSIHCLNASLALLFYRSSHRDTEMQEHIGPPVFKLVTRNTRKNSPFFKNDSNTPQPLMSNPKQERDREGERK